MGTRKLEEQSRLTAEFQSISRENQLLIAEDLEWGLSMRISDGLRFPRNMTLGAIRDDSLIYELGKEIGRQCKIIGVHINLAPVGDVNNNPANPVINDRSFGEDPDNVAKKGVAYAKGLQDAGIIACGKHFPGHGDTDVDSHSALPRIPHPLVRLNEIELHPFRELIKCGVKAVMVGHLLVSALDQEFPATFSSKIVTGLLKQELGFEGLVITDALDMGAIRSLYPPGEREYMALLAGHDILLLPEDVPAAIHRIKRAVEGGDFPENEIDRRVEKILKAKGEMGTLLSEPLITSHSIDLKRRLYEEAITTVGDPFPVGKKIKLVQFGNTGSTHFEEALRERISDEGEVVVALFGMNKFSQQNFGLGPETLEHIRVIHPSCMVVFGSPYSIKLLRAQAPGCNILMAYEDDVDAQLAVAKVILGTLEPKGKLPISLL